MAARAARAKQVQQQPQVRIDVASQIQCIRHGDQYLRVVEHENKTITLEVVKIADIHKFAQSHEMHDFHFVRSDDSGVVSITTSTHLTFAVKGFLALGKPLELTANWQTIPIIFNNPEGSTFITTLGFNSQLWFFRVAGKHLELTDKEHADQFELLFPSKTEEKKDSASKKKKSNKAPKRKMEKASETEVSAKRARPANLRKHIIKNEKFSNSLVHQYFS
jgi:hypothetical protein